MRFGFKALKMKKAVESSTNKKKEINKNLRFLNKMWGKPWIKD